MSRCSRCAEPGGKGPQSVCDLCYAEALRDDAESPSALEHVMENPAIQRLLDRGMRAFNTKVDAVTEKVVGRIDGYAKLAMQMVQAQQQSSTQAAPKRSPREVLHFGPDEQLTADLIKQRKRALASMCHPDKNGSVEAMQAINEAADKLMNEM